MRLGAPTTYGQPPIPKGNVSVLKIHGSCNFLPDLLPGVITKCVFNVSHHEGASELDAPIKIAQSRREILDFCASQDSIAPAIAMYHASKRVSFCRQFLEQQITAFESSIKSAARIYVIGLKVHVIDEHIWRPLASSRAPLFYVGGEPDRFREWARTNGRNNAFALATSFAEAMPRIATHHGL